MPAVQPKRPATSYFLFATEHRGAVAKSLGQAADRKSVSAALADKWKSLDPNQKKQYEEAWRQSKAEYDDNMRAFKESGGVVAPKAARGTRRKRGSGPASHPGGRNATLQEFSDEDFLAEIAHRLVKPGFAGLLAQRLSTSDQQGAKRRKAAVDGEERQREAGEPSEPGNLVLPTTTIEQAEQASVNAAEQEGFESWLAARWEKFKSLADGKSSKKIRAFGLQRWAELSDEKKQKWCKKEDES